MTFVQAVFEFDIELHSFFNIDLFQRGFYQIRLSHKVASKGTQKIEVSHSILGRDTSRPSNSRLTNSLHHAFPPCIIDGAAVSRTFQVLYKNEKVDLNDVVTYRTYLNLDPSRCVEQISFTEFLIIVELWFTEEDFAPRALTSLECVSSRELILHVDLCKGLHYHRPVLFDYFHLSAISLSIHAGLIAFGKPFTRTKPKPNETENSPITYVACGFDSLIFDCSLDQTNAMDWSQMQLRLKRAQLIHWQLCSILFTHLSSLGAKLDEYKEISSKKSTHRNPPPHNGTNIVPNTRSMSNLAQVCYQCSLESDRMDFDLSACHRDLSQHQKNSQSPLRPVSQFRPIDYVTMVESDLTYLSSLCRLQFEQFLKLTVGNKRISRHLAEEHHIHRIRRFAEGFFLISKTRDSMKNNMDSICDTFNQVSDSIRRSAYFQLLPTCHVECKSLDGEASSLPIIFEENFHPIDFESFTPTVKAIEDTFSKLCLDKKAQKQPKNNSTSASSPKESKIPLSDLFTPEKKVDKSTSSNEITKSTMTTTTSSNDSNLTSPMASSDDVKVPPFSEKVVTTDSTGAKRLSLQEDDLNVLTKDSNSSICSKSTSSSLFGFTEAKEEFRRTIGKDWKMYSDLNWFASSVPYFEFDNEGLRGLTSPDQHLIVCVHGLDGNSADLRMVRTFLELALPTCDLVFLMSQRNQGETFDCLDVLTERLAKEIVNHIQTYRLRPAKVSFIGHSLGNIIIRSVLAHPELQHLLPKLHTFLSLSGPHLGTLYNPSGLINLGLWIFQKWKKSASLLQLSMKDHPDPRKSFLYKLSEIKLDSFKNIVLFGSTQDNYVPIHSAHINPCTASLNDASPHGVAYREMIDNLLKPIAANDSCKLVRFDVHHALSTNTSSLIGRAAHIAVLDSELFIEKFMAVCGVKFFS